MGELLYETEIDSAKSTTLIDIAGFADGIYFVEVNDQTAKFVKH
jgi:hypothetical protein